MRPDFGAGLDRCCTSRTRSPRAGRIRDLVQELARALGAPHPARSRRGLGSLERAVPRPVEIAYRLARTGAPGAMRRHRAARRLRNRACPISSTSDPGRPPLRRPRRGPARAHPGAHAGVDESAARRSGPHADRAVRLARRHPALPRQPDPRAAAARVPQAARHRPQAGAPARALVSLVVRAADERRATRCDPAAASTGPCRSRRWPKPPCCRSPPRPTSSAR